MIHDPSLQQAVQDLAVIRRAIDQSTTSSTGTWLVKKAQLLIQGLALAAALFLVGFELSTQRGLSWMLELSRLDRDLAWMGLWEVAAALPFLLAAIYFVAWRTAKHSERSLPEFLERNFQYLRNMGFVSDLFVKFLMLALALVSGHAEWVGALLFLFLGDYLLQGRFFTLPLYAALLLGPLCFACAGVMYYFSSTMLLWPLVAFCLLTSLSLLSISLRRAV
jgi:hypothetical protein